MGLAERRGSSEHLAAARQEAPLVQALPPVWERTTRCLTSTERRPRFELDWKLKPLAKKAKKGFMTPERKKKLRLLLRKKATEELKKEQEMKAAERRKVIDERCGKPKSLDGASEDALVKLCEAYYEKVNQLEGEKYDMEKEVELKDYRINELNIAVNDLRGKFIKPTLKKVSKYENKFAKLQKKASEFSIRTQLKTAKKKEFAMDEGEAEGDKKKPGWALGAKDGEGLAKSGSEGGGLNQGVEEVGEVADVAA